MNKKEVLEIKKQFCHERAALTRICGCYVDGEKNIRTQMREAFHFLFRKKKFLSISKSSRRLYPAVWGET